ncbi:MAG: amino acid adenylation domain-containing protein [Candidatus Dormibacteria bacterium]
MSPARAVSAGAALPEQEQQQLAEWNHTDVDHPLDACLHELIAAQARRTPDAAVSDGRTRLSFAELDDRAGRLASRLGELGAGPEVLVGVCMQPSIDRLVALLGILRAGGAFLPLEPDQPRRRLELMLGEARPQLVLTTGEDCAALPASGAQLLRVDAERASWMASAPLTATGCAPHNLAYVLFTSGSTGTPKGVMVEHRSLVNQLLWAIDWFGITADDRMIQSTSLGFDPSLRELFCPLLSGASLRLLAQADHANPQRLARILGEERITVLACVPSMLEELIAAAAGAYPSLRLVSAGGEVLSPALVRSFFDRFGPAVELRNMYGPTETTVAVSGWRCEPDGEGTIPIGRPVANTQVHLLDARLAAVPIGSPGELCIGGVQVARGYLNRPDLTAERFVANPFRPGERLYRSGDMARHRSDGAIEFLGRRDAQVKIRGIRIELGELEAALARHPAVRQAVAALRRDAQDRQRLVAHVVAHRGHPAPTLAEVRAFLADSLPSSMLPSALVAVDHLPLTQSGKLDRAALPEPDWLRPAAQRAPRTPLEERMAALWARTLRLPRVGIDDDFFELGGHSLLAIRLLVAMEAELGVTVPLAAFLDGNASVAGACALLQPQDGGAQPRPDAGPAPGTRPTVFFVEPGDSAMLTLRHFTRAFGPEQRVVGLLPERRGARFDQSRSVEDLAAGILRTIQQTQPTGPYHLAGWSMGGLLAYEIAGQLRAAGEVVAWLALLDAGPPAFTRQAMQREMSLGQRLARQRQRGVASAVRHTGVVSKRELTAALVRLHLRRSRLGDDFDWRGAHRVASRYSCPGNDAPLDLFLTAPAVAEGPSASLGWEAIHRGPLHIHDIPGEHASMVTEPHVSVVADMLVRTLRRAQAHAEMPR